MPKYQVLRGLEHDYVLYLPAGVPASGTPKKVPSAGHGQDIDTDTSGFIELTADQARPLLAEAVIAAYTPPPEPPAKGKKK